MPPPTQPRVAPKNHTSWGHVSLATVWKQKRTQNVRFFFWSVYVLWLTKGGVGLRQRYAGNAFALFGILFQHFNAPTTVAPHSQTNTLRSWTVEPSGRSSPQMELSCTEAKSLLCNLKRVLSVLAWTGMLCGIREHISISNHSIFDNPLNF